MRVTEEMVNRFLCWKLPEDFSPDNGISFKKESDYNHPQFGRTKFEPMGTNLFNAQQARAMLEHILAEDEDKDDGIKIPEDINNLVVIDNVKQQYVVKTKEGYLKLVRAIWGTKYERDTQYSNQTPSPSSYPAFITMSTVFMDRLSEMRLTCLYEDDLNKILESMKKS